MQHENVGKRRGIGSVMMIIVINKRIKCILFMFFGGHCLHGIPTWSVFFALKGDFLFTRLLFVITFSLVGFI